MFRVQITRASTTDDPPPDFKSSKLNDIMFKNCRTSYLPLEVSEREINTVKIIAVLLSAVLVSIYFVFTSSASADHCGALDPRDHRCPPVIRDHRHPPPVGSLPPPAPTQGNIEVKVSGDVLPNIVWTSPSDTTNQKATILFEAKTANQGQPIEQLGCGFIWREEYMRGTERIPAHWERMRVGEFDRSQMLVGFWTKSPTDPGVYTNKMEANFPVGTTTLGCGPGGGRTPVAVQVAVDNIPPTIIAPTAIVEDSDSSNGKVIEYVVNGTDNSGGPVEVRCDPNSGSLFPIGKTSVKCNATDKFGNSMEKTFSVGVIGNVISGGQDTNTSRAVQQCLKMGFTDVTANGFENDPADFHPPDHAVDGKSSTWWSNQGENSWLRIDIGKDTQMCEVKIEWNKGNEREYTFEISASENGNEFKKIFDGTNQKGHSSAESYQLDDANGRYLMIKVTGSSSPQEWISIKEIGVFGKPL